mmetsp:Transcript_23647/g.62301  ORF Transcript_23647/g.62301 Transcript_23647/m.62301 type:complete len:221 (+) Transcript_23647:528-1190(+)
MVIWLCWHLVDPIALETFLTGREVPTSMTLLNHCPKNTSLQQKQLKSTPNIRCKFCISRLTWAIDFDTMTTVPTCEATDRNSLATSTVERNSSSVSPSRRRDSVSPFSSSLLLIQELGNSISLHSTTIKVLSESRVHLSSKDERPSCASVSSASNPRFATHTWRCASLFRACRTARSTANDSIRSSRTTNSEAPCRNVDSHDGTCMISTRTISWCFDLRP